MQNTVAVISLRKIKSNARKIARAAGVPLIAVVKDDAYGHGAIEVATALHGLVHAFAVSTIEEGAALRIAGITEEILVLTPPLSQEEALRAGEYSLTLSLTSQAVLHICARAAKEHQIPLTAHVAVNTGMNRYGFRPERVKQACSGAQAAGIAVTGIYSHLYAPQEETALRKQQERFDFAVSQAKAVFPELLCHLSATGGALAGVKYDAVRAGIALYGYLPCGFQGKAAVEPAMKLYATVAHSCTQIGGGAGYSEVGHRYKKLHTLRLGYGDGFFRAGGLRAIGKLCMDGCVLPGERRTGRRILVLKDVSAYAHEHGTTEYEVLVNVLKKAVKKYV